ncbi:hypothetical protein N7523_001102 [Penicillium sp. IBT 18751x]|nr:hypothetical protein N7523_001102 [Penicillium sp. IBT 18751x]
MARGKPDQTILGSSKVKEEEHSRIKREELTEESPELKRAQKSSHKVINQDWKNGGEQPGQKIPKHTVKREEAFSFPAEIENTTLGAKISANEGQKYHEKEGIGALKTLKNGLIYFFYRSRVGVSGARGIQDVARSFIVLRPAPPDATSGQSKGSVEFGTKFRLLVVPKKAFPISGRIKEMGFIEKAGITLKELQETFMAGGEYKTETYGTRTIPEATLYAKGVYAITSTQRSSYLSYILTNPQTLGSVQEDFNLRVRGSWLVQSKNPKLSSPASVSLPKGPDYPER